MRKLGRVRVKTGSQGSIRTDCTVINSWKLKQLLFEVASYLFWSIVIVTKTCIATGQVTFNHSV
jgi:hypothetical protein